MIKMDSISSSFNFRSSAEHFEIRIEPSFERLHVWFHLEIAIQSNRSFVWSSSSNWYLDQGMHGAQKWRIRLLDSIHVENKFFAQYNTRDDIVSIWNSGGKIQSDTQLFALDGVLTFGRDHLSTISRDTPPFCVTFRGHVVTAESIDWFVWPWSTVWLIVRLRRWSKRDGDRWSARNFSHHSCRRENGRHHRGIYPVPRSLPTICRSMSASDFLPTQRECRTHWNHKKKFISATSHCYSKQRRDLLWEQHHIFNWLFLCATEPIWPNGTVQREIHVRLSVSNDSPRF